MVIYRECLGYMDDLFEQLQDDARSLWCPSTVKRLDGMPSPDLFYKEYVATSTPVIISGGAETLRRAASWDDLAFLAEPDLEVTVDFTPDGRGDCVVNLGSSRSRECERCELEAVNGPAGVNNTSWVFVKPEERKIRFSSFLDVMLSRDGQSIASSRSCSGGSKGDEVPYLSHQVGPGMNLQGWATSIHVPFGGLCESFSSYNFFFGSMINWSSTTFSPSPEVLMLSRNYRPFSPTP